MFFVQTWGDYSSRREFGTRCPTVSRNTANTFSDWSTYHSRKIAPNGTTRVHLEVVLFGRKNNQQGGPRGQTTRPTPGNETPFLVSNQSVDIQNHAGFGPTHSHPQNMLWIKVEFFWRISMHARQSSLLIGVLDSLERVQQQILAAKLLGVRVRYSEKMWQWWRGSRRYTRELFPNWAFNWNHVVSGLNTYPTRKVFLPI